MDTDGDGYGDMTASAQEACIAIAGTVDNNTDCDDSKANVAPNLQETCDGLDNNW